MIQEAASIRLHTAVDLAKRLVVAEQDAVVAVLTAPDDSHPVFVSFDYWERPGRFEAVVGQTGHTAGCQGATLVAPLICQKSNFTQARHVGDIPAGADEDQVLWIFSFDINDGYDIARCMYSQTGWGYRFEELEVLTGAASLTDESPGFALLHALLTD